MENNFLTYTLKVHAGLENKAIENLKITINKNNLTHWFGEFIIPVKEETVIKKGKATVKQVKLLPNYILVEMDPKAPQEVIRQIVNTNRVQGFLGIDSFTPTPLSEDEKNNLLNINKKKEQSDFDIEINDKVRITEGPFSNFEGTVDSINGNKIKVIVSIFGRPTPVELSHLELVIIS